MNSKIIFFVIMLVSVTSNLISSELADNKSPSKEETISIYCSPDLYTLTTAWVEEFKKVTPGIKIDVIKADPGNIDFKKTGNLGFISHEYFSKIENNESAWKIVVGRDIIVPVINSKNPYLEEINNKGISAVKIKGLFVRPENKVWGTLLGNDQNVPVTLYLIDDESFKSVISGFIETNKTLIKGSAVKNGKELISAVQKDKYAIGFCKLIDIIDLEKQQVTENLVIMPVDRNGNGKIDYSEKIYSDLTVFTRGVWIGKYPKTLFSNIYSISNAQPKNESEIAFLRWLLTDGQKLINQNGYIDLTGGERQSKIDKLIPTQIEPSKPEINSANIFTVVLVLTIFVILGFITIALIRTGKPEAATEIKFTPAVQETFNEYSVSHLNGLYFDKTHTWVFMEKDGNVTIGIDDFLQHVTGPITQIKLRNPGEKVKKGEPVLSIIQKGKQLNINSPISGIIREQNQILISNPSLINSSPYMDGWIYMIEPLSWLREIQFLFMTNSYRKWLKYEYSRLKDFISLFIKPGTVEYGHVILQDGGELKDNLLSEFGPDVWEEFQTNFIDTSK